MSRVEVHGLRKTFGGKVSMTAIESLELEIQEGEFLALLGPSGCGKTTTLRSVAGLERPDQGTITIGDTTVFDAGAGINIRPDRRQLGMVFQSYALWPHMSVGKNIAYPLKARRQSAALRGGRVDEIARMVECDHLLDRLPGQLSGGQQQRVALARALVAQPEVILFDEPLSNLDARLRDQMRAEIHRIHRSRPFTAIYVTHDQSEALALGHRIAIMRAGQLEQLGTPEEIFERPVSEYVAGFIGMANRLEFTCVDGTWTTDRAPVIGATGLLRWAPQVAARFDPHDARLAVDQEHLFDHEVAIPVRVIDIEFGGRHRHFTVQVGETMVRLSMLRDGPQAWTRTVEVGDRALLALDPGRLAVFDTDTAESIAAAGVAEPAVDAPAECVSPGIRG